MAFCPTFSPPWPPLQAPTSEDRRNRIEQEKVAEIRRLFYAEHWKIGTIAAFLHLNPNTVRAAVERHRCRAAGGLR